MDTVANVMLESIDRKLERIAIALERLVNASVKGEQRNDAHIEVYATTHEK